MSVYRGPVCRLCRREGRKIFLKGTRCYTAKCSQDKRSFPPGQHGQSRFFMKKEYGIQLREKQKVKRTVFMTEKQFKRFFNIAEREKGPTGVNLLVSLECRLDNIVKRLGFSTSILQARQIISHRHIQVNGRLCDIPSYVVKEGDKISVGEKSRDYEIIKNSLKENETLGVPGWLEVDVSSLTGTVKRKPTREEITLSAGDIQENLIVELYSK